MRKTKKIRRKIVIGKRWEDNKPPNEEEYLKDKKYINVEWD